MKNIFLSAILFSIPAAYGQSINHMQQIVMDQVKNSLNAAGQKNAPTQPDDSQFQPTNDEQAATPSNASQTEIQQSNAAAGLGLQNTQQYQDAQKNLDAAKSQANTQKSINPGSKKGKKSQSSGAMMNMGAMAALMAACMATPQHPIIPLCIMGAQAGQQAAADKSAADKSGKTYEASKMGFSNPAEVETPAEDNGSAGFDPKTQEGLDMLKKEGYAITENGVRFPDGSFKPNSAFNNAASMAAAGIDPKMASEAAAVLAKMNLGTKEDPNQPHLLNVGVDSGGGGGYSPPSAGGGGSDGATASYNPWALNAEARRKLVEGKSMNLAGEPIGVKGDDLFDMVHRAYEKKRKTANFIEGEEAATSVRLPASVKKPAH